MPSSKMPIEVFCAYAREDEVLHDELEKHLSPLQRQRFIFLWYDRHIVPGGNWVEEIDTHLTTASIILLLISPDFFASDYCYSIEMQRAMERHQRGEAQVIPIILRPVDWQGAPFASLQGLPHDMKPVTSWSNHDEAFLDIAGGLRVVLEKGMRHHAPPAKINLDYYLSSGFRLIKDDPYSGGYSEDDIQVKQFVKRNLDQGFDFIEHKKYQEIIELWKPMFDKQAFNVNYEAWDGAPLFLCQIQTAKNQLFIAHLQLGQGQDSKEHISQAFYLLEEIISCDPYSMSGPSSHQLHPNSARIQNRNYLDILELALKWFDIWSPYVLNAIFEIPLRDAEVIKETVYWRIGLLRSILQEDRTS